MTDKILIEVAYAIPQKQIILECEVDAGSSARTVVLGSGIDSHFPEIELAGCELGVFGKAVADDDEFAAGDRIEN
jgi:putative ubiquitin-RnfH superfamily antitoxin RatB of RatAB toxin-antitoxin module